MVRRIPNLALQFGPRLTTWPLIAKPVEGGLYDAFIGVEDAALFVTLPGHPVGGWSNALREHRAAVASQRSIKPQDLGMRFSPWLRGGLRLNTTSEGREHVRAFAETVSTTSFRRAWSGG